jgi:ABC-type bacteriocin/lantibiotic exporter with double-glycine peptidase domain
VLSRFGLHVFTQARVGLVASIRNAWNTSFDLIEEVVGHRFFQSLRDVDWSKYQLDLILMTSVLINLLELASPLYLNIVYTSVLPSGAMSSLVVMTVAVVLLMGLINMFRGGSSNTSQKLMRWRVGLRGLYTSTQAPTERSRGSAQGRTRSERTACVA